MLTKTDPSMLQSYLEDSSNLQGGHADGVYLPENEAEVAEILKESSAKQRPLTISGGCTGTTGGCIPFGGWILGTEKLNKIIDIDPKARKAIVQPAVTLEALDTEVKKHGLLYPPDPTETTAWLGGTVATNASGSRSFKFGATRDWIKRIKIAFTSGEITNIPRKQAPNKLQVPNYQIPNIKTSAGYYSKPGMDLIDLFIGSEGTLGVVTEIEVALIARFKETYDIIAFFPNEDKAVDFVEEAKKREVLTLEYFDQNSLELLRPSYPNIPPGAGAAVYFEIDHDPEAWSDLDSTWLGMNDKQKEDLRKFRHAMPEHINEEFKKHGTVKFASDIAVPDNKFREMLAFYNSNLIPHTPNLFYVKFGHIGQNHLHVNLVPRTQKDIPVAQELIMKFVKKGISLGGTCSAEHGIGKIKHVYLKEMFGDKGLAEMVRIKKLFDPACILNPGNLFPKDLLK